MTIEEEQRHIVVFDCNIYLDVARLLGPPFGWDEFDAKAASCARASVPHPDDLAYDSLRAIASCMSGRFAGDESLEVWTSAHIDKTIRYKAEQSTAPDLKTGHSGLGWTAEDAQTIVDELVHGVTTASSGGTLGHNYPDSEPPLDHEDGMVYGSCRKLASEDPLSRVYCVTRDRGFLKAYGNGELESHTIVLPPSRFVALIRLARKQFSIRQMGGR